MKISRNRKPEFRCDVEWRSTALRSKRSIAHAKFGEIIFELRDGFHFGYVVNGQIWKFAYDGSDLYWPFKRVRRWAYRIWTGETRKQAYKNAKEYVGD